MFSYQIKVVISKYKLDEFIECLFSLSDEIRKEEGCVDYSLYQDIEKKNTYSMIGEWRTRQAMEKHFKRKKFSVLIGATKVLSENLEMSIGETLEKGNYQLAKEKITFQPKQGKAFTF